MQSKGAIRLVVICLLLACLWELSFTLVTKIQGNKAKAYAEKCVAELTADSAKFNNEVKAEDQAHYLDGVRAEKNRYYIDSIASEKVYLGYTFKKVREKEINLGLDLKGGMNVMLQVQLEDLIKALANNPTPEFAQALAKAKENSVNSRSDLITLFGEAWKEVGNGTPLAQIFGSPENKIAATAKDAEVLDYISEQAKSAIDNSFNVLRNRIDRFGVAQPSIQQIGNSGKILIELPGVKEPERVRKLLQGTASLEFWETYENAEVYQFLAEADALLAQVSEDEAEVVEAEAEKSESDIVAEEIGTSNDDQAAIEAEKKAHPLFSVLMPNVYNGSLSKGACIGYANYADTAKINSMLSNPQVKAVLPDDFRPMWAVKPVQGDANGTTFELVAIKVTTRDGKAKLDGEVVTDARVQYSNTGGSPEVSMSMNATGASIWAKTTEQNIGKQIAIVLDGMVYSYPVVNSAITGGSSQITGNFTLDEAEDLANVLKSGKLPAPATIIQEQVVGPTLGSKSIKAGLLSFAIAFLLVLVYMVFFYQGAGLVADIALICNVVLLFGALVSFGAVLTLPGIAGLVLTLGMAVDANVIIYERVKEELKSGKGLGKAIQDGYSNAYSAIIDGQFTTLLTGIVLYVFGSGPVQGFATTLIIGIITSVLSSIFITRIIFDDRVVKGKNVSFTNKLTENFLKNTHIDFIGKRKIAYIVSGALILISILSISIKGFTYGVDFSGGRTYVVRFDKPVVTEDVRAAVEKVFDAADQSANGSSVEVKQFGGESQVKITTSYKVKEESTEVDQEIEAMLFEAVKGFFTNSELTIEDFKDTANNPNGIISSDKVGATIANDVKRGAVIAVIIALFVIFAYIAVRFRKWTWGLGGVASLAHTAIIVIGFFSLFTGILPFNLDVDSTFIAAILTIIGYAINDNVVIFDRIREYVGLHPKADFKEVTNEALNSTLSRTMNTSMTTLLTMLAIAIFGGEIIRGLAVALILGIIIGTYASLFIGTTVMYDVTVASEKKKALKK